MLDVKCSTVNLVDPEQIGWVEYREGDAAIALKVIRPKRKKEPFLAPITGYRSGISVASIKYPNQETWDVKAKALLEIFRQWVGDGYYFKGEAPIMRGYMGLG